MHNHRLRGIVRLLRAGGLIAYPTEAVFGLGCDPDNARAIARLLRLKGRDPDKGLILIAADATQLAPYLGHVPTGAWQRATRTWPGPYTWLLPAAPGIPHWLRGRHDTLAVRVTAHPLAARLCRAFGKPLVSTSANRSGMPPARTTLAVRRRLGRELDAVLAGATGGASRPSEIRDGRSGRLVRAG